MEQLGRLAAAVARPLTMSILQGVRAERRLKMALLRPAFKSHGRNFVFDPNGKYTYHTIEVGDDVFIGPGATLHASHSGIVLGNKVMCGPNVTILGGDHNTTIVGQFMTDVTYKRPSDDLAVVIEDDVWLGCGVTVLKGVRVGRGSILAAGAIATRDVRPYTIVAGIPARVVGGRFDLEVSTILRHEESLYPKGQRLTREELAAIRSGVKGEAG